MEYIATNKAPGAIGPYSQGNCWGNLLFTSGQIPVDPVTGQIPEGISAQADQSCRNVRAVLEAGGAGVENVLYNNNSLLLNYLDEEYEIDPAEFLSMGKASTFTGWRVFGRCKATVCDGKLVYKEEV